MDTRDSRDEKGRFKAGFKQRAYSHEQMAQFIDAYCIHIANGGNKHTFVYVGGCDYRTIESYLNFDDEETDTYLRMIKIGLIEKVRKAFAKSIMLFDTLLTAKALGIRAKIERFENGRVVEENINPKDINFRMLIFIVKGKFPDIWGGKTEKQKPPKNKKSTGLKTDSTVQIRPIEIIDPKTGKIEELHPCEDTGGINI